LNNPNCYVTSADERSRNKNETQTNKCSGLGEKLKSLSSATRAGATETGEHKMRYAILLLTVLIMTLACTQDVAGIDSSKDTARTILFTVTGSMGECLYVTYTNAEGGSTIIDNCMVPFSVAVDVPATSTIQITAGKRPDGNITVCVIENSAIIGYNIAKGEDMEAQWIEGQ
jgi:hypothetical protein